ncbi:MAG TPA: hypothetical protein VK106_01495, partial [Balneolaceae bacterium]|nr:hypothetical protein [Balneolaceae bacterium]
MKRELLEKYFKDQNTDEELEEVLEWFQTEEGEEYLEDHISEDVERGLHGEKLRDEQQIPTEKLYHRILRS